MQTFISTVTGVIWRHLSLTIPLLQGSKSDEGYVDFYSWWPARTAQKAFQPLNVTFPSTVPNCPCKHSKHCLYIDV